MKYVILILIGFIIGVNAGKHSMINCLPEEISLAEKGDLLIVNSTKPLEIGFYHECADKTHQTCDENCECDSLGCK